MAIMIKRGLGTAELAAADAKVRATVEAALADIEQRGDAAVRELSVKFDDWDREDFRLSAAEIERCLAQVGAQDLERHPLRPGPGAATSPRSSARALKDVEVETLPGVILGHKNIPVQLGRLLRARRQLPDGRLGAHVGGHRQGRRRPAHRHLRAALPGPPGRGDRRRPAPGRRRRDLRPRRHPGGRRDGARHRDDRRRSTCWSAPATPSSPRPSASCSAASGSTCSPARPRPSSSPTTRSTPRCAPPTCSARPSTGRPRRRCCSPTRRRSRATPMAEVERLLEQTADRRDRRARPGATTAR